MKLENVFNSLEEKAADSVRAEQGDYIIDGLLHCGKCNTPKQTRVEIFGQVRTPLCLCKCQVEKRDREEAERKRIENERRIQNLRRVGFPDEEMQKWTFDKDDRANEHITNIALKYVENFKTMRESGKGLLLYGKVGTGKTFAAACIANALIDKGFPCLVTNFDSIRNTLFGMYAGKQEYINGFNNFDLLVIDDLESESNTKDMDGIIYNVIDSRYRAGLPLIITTNLTGEELKNTADIRKQRIYSRLFEQCIPVEVKGKDRRRDKLRRNVKVYADILGL